MSGNKYHHLNWRYAFANAAMIMISAGLMAYGYNYLSHLSVFVAPDGTVRTGAVGVVLSGISVLNILGQTLLGGLVDRSAKLDEKKAIRLCMMLTVLFGVLVLATPDTTVLKAVFTALCSACSWISVPMLNAMAFLYEQDGQKINYGMCRAAGSVSYAIAANILGRLWASLGRDVVVYYTMIMSLLTLAAISVMPDAPEKAAEAVPDKTTELSYRAYFRRYRGMTLATLALIPVVFSLSLTGSYNARFIASIIGPEAAAADGAVEAVQGNGSFISAMCELPTMFLFSRLMDKFGVKKMLGFAGIMYAVRLVVLYLADSVGMYYFAMSLQMFTFAIMLPATVYLVNYACLPQDRNKGQSLIMAAETAASLLASLLGGQLFQIMGEKQVLLVGVIVSAVGAVSLIAALTRVPPRGQTTAGGAQ